MTALETSPLPVNRQPDPVIEIKKELKSRFEAQALSIVRLLESRGFGPWEKVFFETGQAAALESAGLHLRVTIPLRGKLTTSESVLEAIEDESLTIVARTRSAAFSDLDGYLSRTVGAGKEVGLKEVIKILDGIVKLSTSSFREERNFASDLRESIFDPAIREFIENPKKLHREPDMTLQVAEQVARYVQTKNLPQLSAESSKLGAALESIIPPSPPNTIDSFLAIDGNFRQAWAGVVQASKWAMLPKFQMNRSQFDSAKKYIKTAVTLVCAQETEAMRAEIVRVSDATVEALNFAENYSFAKAVGEIASSVNKCTSIKSVPGDKDLAATLQMLAELTGEPSSVSDEGFQISKLAQALVSECCVHDGMGFDVCDLAARTISPAPDSAPASRMGQLWDLARANVHLGKHSHDRQLSSLLKQVAETTHASNADAEKEEPAHAPLVTLSALYLFQRFVAVGVEAQTTAHVLDTLFPEVKTAVAHFLAGACCDKFARQFHLLGAKQLVERKDVAENLDFALSITQSAIPKDRLDLHYKPSEQVIKACHWLLELNLQDALINPTWDQDELVQSLRALASFEMRHHISAEKSYLNPVRMVPMVRESMISFRKGIEAHHAADRVRSIMALEKVGAVIHDLTGDSEVFNEGHRLRSEYMAELTQSFAHYNSQLHAYEEFMSNRSAKVKSNLQNRQKSLSLNGIPKLEGQFEADFCSVIFTVGIFVNSIYDLPDSGDADFIQFASSARAELFSRLKNIFRLEIPFYELRSLATARSRLPEDTIDSILGPSVADSWQLLFAHCVLDLRANLELMKEANADELRTLTTTELPRLLGFLWGGMFVCDSYVEAAPDHTPLKTAAMKQVASLNEKMKALLKSEDTAHLIPRDWSALFGIA